MAHSGLQRRRKVQSTGSSVAGCEILRIGSSRLQTSIRREYLAREETATEGASCWKRIVISDVEDGTTDDSGTATLTRSRRQGGVAGDRRVGEFVGGTQSVSAQLPVRLLLRRHAGGGRFSPLLRAPLPLRVGLEMRFFHLTWRVIKFCSAARLLRPRRKNIPDRPGRGTSSFDRGPTRTTTRRGSSTQFDCPGSDGADEPAADAVSRR